MLRLRCSLVDGEDGECSSSQSSTVVPMAPRIERVWSSRTSSSPITSLSCSAASTPTSSLATTTNAMNPGSGLVPSSGCRVLGGQNIRNYRRRHGRRQRCHADQPKEKRCAPCTGGKPNWCPPTCKQKDVSYMESSSLQRAAS